METGQGDPLGLTARPAKSLECPFASPQVDDGSARRRVELLLQRLHALRINFEVQQGLGFRVVFITLLLGEEAESFTRSVVELLSDAVASMLGDVGHAGTLR